MDITGGKLKVLRKHTGFAYDRDEQGIVLRNINSKSKKK